MKIKQEDLYTNLEQSELVAPIMEKLGIQCDGIMYIYYDKEEFYENKNSEPIEYHVSPEESEIPKVIPKATVCCKVYRLDKLLLALPKLYFGIDIDNGEEYVVIGGKTVYNLDLQDQIYKLRKKILETFKGLEAIAAAVDLLVLLDQEGLRDA